MEYELSYTEDMVKYIPGRVCDTSVGLALIVLLDLSSIIDSVYAYLNISCIISVVPCNVPLMSNGYDHKRVMLNILSSMVYQYVSKPNSVLGGTYA